MPAALARDDLEVLEAVRDQLESRCRDRRLLRDVFEDDAGDAPYQEVGDAVAVDIPHLRAVLPVGAMRLALALMVLALAAGWRVLAAHVPALSNFAPLMALTFCAAVYLQDKRMWLVPFAALFASDLYLDYHYAAT